MSLNRYAKRRDANESELFQVARQLGAKIEVAGPLDAWVGWRGVWYPVEVKTKRGRYTSDQVLFLSRSKDNRLPVWTWRTVEDVFNSLGVSHDTAGLSKHSASLHVPGSLLSRQQCGDNDIEPE